MCGSPGGERYPDARLPPIRRRSTTGSTATPSSPPIRTVPTDRDGHAGYERPALAGRSGEGVRRGSGTGRQQGEAGRSGRQRTTKDRYGRLLRYVQVKKIDVGFELQLANLAKARYDSLDGFPWHPRERSYRMLGATLDRKAVCQWEKVAPLLLAGVGDDHDDEKSTRHLRHLLTTGRRRCVTCRRRRMKSGSRRPPRHRLRGCSSGNSGGDRQPEPTAEVPQQPLQRGGTGSPLPGGGQSCPPGGCWSRT